MSINDLLSLVKENFRLILYIALFLLMLIIFLIACLRKPNKIIDTVAEQVAVILPTFIRIAEEKFGSGHGDQKNAYVISLVQEWFSGENLEFTEYYLKLTKKLIEQILNTPEKK